MLLWYEKLKFARKVLKLSLRQVEKATGVSNAYLCQLENGQIKEPSFFKMIVLINFYNLEVSDFIEKEIMQVKDTKITAGISNNLLRDTSEKNKFVGTTNGIMMYCLTCGKYYLKGAMCPRCFGWLQGANYVTK